MKTYDVIEMLECALYNCDNVKKAGLPFVDIVKMQIQSAIDMLEESEGKDDSNES